MLRQSVLCMVLIVITSQLTASQSGVRVSPKTRQDLIQEMINAGEIDVACVAQTGGPQSFPVSAIDLNQDGKPEFIVTGHSGCGCGGRRRSQWVYRGSGRGYELLLRADGPDEILPQKTSTNGYRDLKVITPAPDGYSALIELYRFDGSQYRENYSAPSSGTKITQSSGPAIPYEDVGACPFECCVYRQWIANKATVLHADRRSNSPVIFNVRKGEKVTAITGVVITTRVGTAMMLKPDTLGPARRNLSLKAGDVLYLLTYEGEGFYKVWFKGSMFSYGLDDPSVKILSNPQSVWWVKMRNKQGQIGWRNQPENFDNKDQCAHHGLH